MEQINRRELIRRRSYVAAASVQRNMKEYCRRGSVHGLQYLIEAERPRFEKYLDLSYFNIALAHKFFF